MKEDRPRPIYSDHDDDVALRESIDDFVIGLAETIDALQDAFGDGDLDDLAQRCDRLCETATRLGFSPLADVSGQVARSCQHGKAEDAEGALIELTDVARRVRLGHRGAAG